MKNDSFEHLARQRQYPAQAAASQAAINAARLAAVERALLFRPHFLPLFHTLPAAAQSAPISETTDTEDFDVIVTGAITDGEDRSVRFYRNRNPRSMINVGNSPNLRLSLDAIAGHSVATAGYAGVKDWEEPLLLTEKQYLALEIFQETSPGGAEQVATCFNGVRCFTPAHAEAQLSRGNRKAVENAIALRPAPELKFAVCQVTFDASGNAITELPVDDEPMMVLGHRSTFTDALISFGFTRQSTFSKQAFPIWALCNEPNNDKDLYGLLPVPLFVAPQEKVIYQLSNKIDTVSAEPLIATDGQIEVLLQTM